MAVLNTWCCCYCYCYCYYSCCCCSDISRDDESKVRYFTYCSTVVVNWCSTTNQPVTVILHRHHFFCRRPSSFLSQIHFESRLPTRQTLEPDWRHDSTVKYRKLWVWGPYLMRLGKSIAIAIVDEVLINGFVHCLDFWVFLVNMFIWTWRLIIVVQKPIIVHDYLGWDDTICIEWYVP